MNHAVAQRLTRFAEDAARVERKVDEILVLLRPLTKPAGFITTPDGGRIPVDPERVVAADLPGALAGVRAALHAYGHVHHAGEDPEHAIRRALDVERARRDAAINEERETRSLARDLTDKLDRALDELASTKAAAATLCREWPGHDKPRVLGNGVVVIPGSAPFGSPGRRRWWGRLRR